MKKPFITTFSNAAHRKHCKAAKCMHPAIHFGKVQGWCARCRAVAFGDGTINIDGKTVDVTR